MQTAPTHLAMPNMAVAEEVLAITQYQAEAALCMAAVVALAAVQALRILLMVALRVHTRLAQARVVMAPMAHQGNLVQAMAVQAVVVRTM